MGRNLPVCGGGYFRLLPKAILAGAIRETNRAHQPAIVYLHPYELDVNEPAVLRRNGWPISWQTYLRQSLFRGRIAGRLAALFEEFRFAPIADVLGLSDSRRQSGYVEEIRTATALDLVPGGAKRLEVAKAGV